MILKKIIVKNFRGYQGEHIFEINDGITALIGKNDAGKSTLLEALEIFFGESKPEISDLNIYTDPTDRIMSFGCVFSDLPEKITVDVSAETTLQDEYLINENGEFEVIVTYACSEKSVAVKPDKFIRAMHPTAKGYDDLLKLKISDLKNRGDALGVNPPDKRVNSQWRKVIWENAPNLEVRKTQLAIDEFDAKAKSIYANIESSFPQYYIFKVDRQTTDSDSEAKDPMQLAVKEAQKEFQAEITDLQQKIKSRVDKVTEDALKKLHEMDPSLASKLSPVLKSAPKWQFDYKIEDDRGISLNKRGSGTRRLVLLNFFRAEAEKRSAQNSGNIIYAIEEPETSQHPNNQKLVIDALLELSKDQKRQVIITTHSPQLTSCLPSSAVLFIEFDVKAKNIITHTGEAGIAKAADSLGILANQRYGSAKAVVIVEGESDEIFLNHAANMLAISGQITSNLKDAGILVLPAGGCSQIPFWVQKLRLKNLGLPYAIFLDSDRQSSSDPPTINESFCASLKSNGEVAITTRKREIENYIDPSISGITCGEFDDAKKLIAAHKHIRKDSKVIGQLWPHMTEAQITSVGTYKDGSLLRSEITEIIEEILSIT